MIWEGEAPAEPIRQIEQEFAEGAEKTKCKCNFEQKAAKEAN